MDPSRYLSAPPAVPFHLIKSTLNAIRKALPTELQTYVDDLVPILGLAWGRCIDIDEQQSLYKRIFNTWVKVIHRVEEPLFDGSLEAWRRLLALLPSKTEVAELVKASDRSLPRATIVAALDSIVAIDKDYKSAATWRTRFKNDELYNEWESVKPFSQLCILLELHRYIEKQKAPDELPEQSYRPSLGFLKGMIHWKKRKASSPLVPEQAIPRQSKGNRPMVSTTRSRAQSSLPSQELAFPFSAPYEPFTQPTLAFNDARHQVDHHHGPSLAFNHSTNGPSPFEAGTRGGNDQHANVFVAGTGQLGHQNVFSQNASSHSSLQQTYGFPPHQGYPPVPQPAEYFSGQGCFEHNLNNNGNFGQ